MVGGEGRLVLAASADCGRRVCEHKKSLPWKEEASDAGRIFLSARRMQENARAVKRLAD